MVHLKLLAISLHSYAKKWQYDFKFVFKNAIWLVDCYNHIG